MKQALLLLLPACSLAFTAAAQGVGIGTTQPDAAAALEVKSTTQGFLPPRLTQSQRLQVPVSSYSPGLLVYQTDDTSGYYFYTGTAWVQLGPTAKTRRPHRAPSTFPGGGGAGGVVVRAAKGTMTVAGFVRANGASGLNGNGGVTGAGGAAAGASCT